MLLALLSSVLTITAVGFVFAVIAHVVFRRGHLVALFACWIACSVGVTALMIWRIHQQQSLLGFTPAQIAARPLWLWFLPMWALGLGGMCLRIWQRRASSDELILRSSLASLPIYFAGLLLFLAIFALIDLSAWLS